ncbi:MULTISPECIES: DUF4190 domain-containing protein [Niallia]|uniref:DUF4190 domain-containing protein n=2 Tax=Niallia TaxID=2837506 RepID=A0A941GGT1_NIACI|nr:MULTISPECIES: DUF4190 domain-containing protein [Niallia]MCB5239623.1 DUF4190 domain-containing protein [Niallia circulans]NMO76517.1 DUF4190 domain-containing protein [Niallia alba]UTI44234.1 DUF4190 domain-containing protein [Niallia sp. RD1]
MNNQTNTNSIISLTFGILSLLIPIIGLILGIISIVFSRKAVNEINRTNENGRGFATAGLICSIVGIIFQLLILLGVFAFFSVSTFG